MARKTKAEDAKLAEVVILLDRSGSMQQGREDHEGGLRAFVQEQKKLPGEMLFSFFQFDSSAPFEIIHDGTPLKDIDSKSIVLHPRGRTPLLEAVGRSVAHVRERHDKAKVKPEMVIFMIVTDGMENASGPDWTKARVKSAIQDCEKDGWKILYLGADVDAFAEASTNFGLRPAAALNFKKNPEAIKGIYMSASNNLGHARAMYGAGSSGSMAGQSMNWSQADRDKADES